MSKKQRLFRQILGGQADANISFDGLCRLLTDLGFRDRTKGSHRIFVKDGVEEIINLQPRGGKAKPYQVKQVRALILKYKLGGQFDESQQI